jgi:hypothetical protein
LSFDFLEILGIPTVAELEGSFLRSFLKGYGAYPICNNQSGIELRPAIVFAAFEVDWVPFA